MRLATVSLMFAATIAAGACSGSATHQPAAASARGYPVSVQNCGTTVTFDAAPTRAVANDINAAEEMLALGLGPRMIGTFGVRGDGPTGQPIPAEYLAAFAKVPDISDDYFTVEKLVGLRPDFLFAGWNYGLKVGTTSTPDNLAHYGIKTLALSESCAAVQTGLGPITVEDTYRDLSNLGVIFGAQARADEVITRMRTEIATAQARVRGLPPVTVFDYDSGESAPFTAGGLATPTALLALAGGKNVFASLQKSFTSVSWEQVVAADPQCILINDYGTPTAAQKQQFLETSPITRNLTAVKSHCFLTLPYDEITPSPRNAEAVTSLARWLHPGGA